jgi:hypothetical protein
MKKLIQFFDNLGGKPKMLQVPPIYGQLYVITFFPELSDSRNTCNNKFSVVLLRLIVMSFYHLYDVTYAIYRSKVD